MGSHSKQAVALTAFLISFIFLSAALAGGGLLFLLLFLALLGCSLVLLRRCKAIEETAE